MNDVTLRDIHRRPVSLSDFADKRAVVVAFIGTECPIANLAVPRLIALHEKYAEQGVQFLAINSNVQDEFIEVSAHAQEREIPFPVLKDFDHSTADAFGATRTPEYFVLDADRVIQYHGRLDDQYTIGFTRSKASRHDLAEAIEDVLADLPVEKPTTRVEGCKIGRATDPRVPHEVTYTKDVAPIIQKRCQECHREGEIAPMSLASYDDARDWAETIHEVVLEQRMPPWHADPRFSEFSNDRSMTREETETLLAWVEQRTPEGDAGDLPPPADFTDGWVIGQPDFVIDMGEDFDVPETGVVEYQKFLVDPGFTEDVWVRRAEARPSNRAVVHHIIVYIQTPGKPLYAQDGTTSMLTGWAPGDMPTVYPEGTASRIPAGSKFIFEVHYTPNGVACKDRSQAGIVFAKEPPQYEVETNILANMDLNIPPGEPNHEDDFHYTFKGDAKILGFMPHMHLRGVSANYEVTYPDGEQETLLSIPDWDFNWQSTYRFQNPIDVPKGTKLKFTAIWDNSPNNPRNPDPTEEVHWGLQTWEEMQNGWLEVVWKDKPVAGE
ncbi:MAG: redoxin domain-containing protein [Planctomycetaceae bacterium]|nr:redoxin domain-containing protein [Planctomycetaceae bacterium]